MAGDEIERDLICRVIADGNIEAVIEARINESFFADDEHRSVWNWLLEHWSRYSTVPGRGALRSNFPTWKTSRAPEPLKYYTDQLRKERTYNIALATFLEATDALKDHDGDEVIRLYVTGAQDALSQVSSMKNDILTQTGDARLEMYADFARNPGKLRGMSTGFDTIDRATRGIQPEQYIVIAGGPKAGKSTVLLAMGVYLNEVENARVLLVSFEMSREEQWARHDAIRAEISHNRLLDGRMTNKDRKRLEASSKRMLGYQDFVLSSDISATTTVSGIRAQVEQVRPDIVLVDGVYLMEDERGERTGSPQAYTNISRDIKRMAQATKIPVVVTTQALENKMNKRGTVTAGSLGYSSAWGQDCDALIGIEPVPDEDGVSLLKVLLSRSGPLAQTRIRVDWEKGTVSELQEEVSDDDGEETYSPTKANF